MPYEAIVINEAPMRLHERPLSGTTVFILSDVTGKGSDADEAVFLNVEALGGNRTFVLEDATHVLWYPPHSGDGGTPRYREEVHVVLLEILGRCQSLSIPVVDSSWLERMAGLSRGEHWSEVDVGPYVPAIVALTDDFYGRAGGRGDIDVETAWFDGSEGAGVVVSAVADSSKGPDGFWAPVKSRTRALEGREDADVAAALAASLKSDRAISVALAASKRMEKGKGKGTRWDMGASIGETYQYLSKEKPELLEEDEIRRAMELSMLDCALVLSRRSTGGMPNTLEKNRAQSPHEVLGVEKGASPAQIRAAYRRRAKETHPDKGGRSGEFENVAIAYRSLLDGISSEDRAAPVISLKGTAHWDKELQEHRNLVQEMFQSHGENIDSNVALQMKALDSLGLKAYEAGSLGLNENNEIIRNVCFYLSLATSYLSGIGALEYEGKDEEEEMIDPVLQDADGALVTNTALHLKRVVEAAVVSAHPEWAQQGMIGDGIQAFSDFLVYSLDSPTLLSEWAVVIFDSVSGFVDIYKGKNFQGGRKNGGKQDGNKGENDIDNYENGEAKMATQANEETIHGATVGMDAGDKSKEIRREIDDFKDDDDDDDDDDDNWSCANTITLRFEPGHYQPILPTESTNRPSLKKVLKHLTEVGVIYVVTDGKA